MPSRVSRIRVGVMAWYVEPDTMPRTPVTWTMEVPVAAPLVPVTVWSPLTVDVHTAAVHVPPLTLKVVVEVTSPRLWPPASYPVAVYV